MVDIGGQVVGGSALTVRGGGCVGVAGMRTVVRWGEGCLRWRRDRPMLRMRLGSSAASSAIGSLRRQGSLSHRLRLRCQMWKDELSLCCCSVEWVMLVVSDEERRWVKGQLGCAGLRLWKRETEGCRGRAQVLAARSRSSRSAAMRLNRLCSVEACCL